MKTVPQSPDYFVNNDYGAYNNALKAVPDDPS